MGESSTDPTAVSVVAVTADDVVAAYEANRQRDAGAVLRVTPPFSGRMRARLHVPQTDSETAAAEGSEPDATTGPATPDADATTDGAPGAGVSGAATPVRIPPADLIADDAPPYPTAADTEDELRADPDAEYTVERHRERHERALSAWRTEVRDYFVDEVAIATPEGAHSVAVTVLG